MTRGRLVFLLVSVALVAPVVSGTLSRAADPKSDGEDSLYKHLSVFTEVLSLVQRAYVEETSEEELFGGAFYGAMDALDPLAVFVPAEHVEAFAEAQRIGDGRSGAIVVKDRGNPWILAVRRGGPAQEAGLKRGDLLAEIDGKAARAMPLWEIRRRFAGEPGTRLELRLQRMGQSREVTLTLRDFEPQPPAIERIDELPVLRLTGFGPQTAERVRALLTELAVGGDDRLLIDLRGAAGGLAEAAYAIAELFVRGPLGSLESRGESLTTFTGEADPLWSGRLVVLTDRSSQGASEILASILRHAADAELVGERTFGHAGRQVMVSLSSGAQALITDAYYAGPDGELLDVSLEPDETVSEASRSFAESEVPLEDLILRRGIERLRGGEVPARRAA